MSDNKILDAVKQLDPTNDNHWIADGSARLDTVKMLAGDPTLTRETLDAAVPGFNRSTAPGYGENTEAAPAADGSTPAAPAPEVAPPAPEVVAPAAPVVAQTPPVTADGETVPPAPVVSAEDAAALRDGAVPASGEGEAQLGTLDHGFVGDTDEVEALEAKLETASAHTERVKRYLDEGRAELDAAMAEESSIRQQLDAVRPRTGTMTAIQDYFASQDQMASDQATARQALIDSGVDLSAIQKLVGSSPIDKATAEANKRASEATS